MVSGGTAEMCWLIEMEGMELLRKHQVSGEAGLGKPGPGRGKLSVGPVENRTTKSS